MNAGAEELPFIVTVLQPCGKSRNKGKRYDLFASAIHRIRLLLLGYTEKKRRSDYMC